MDEVLYVSLGPDCSLAYQLKEADLRTIALPFDWCVTKNINHMIKDILENNISSFFDKDSWKFKELKGENHLIESGSEIARFRLIHKIYKCEYPHELIKLEDFDIFIEKYKRRIERFQNLDSENKKLIFVRLGNYDSELETILKEYYKNFYKIKYIDISGYEFYSWKRENINLVDLIIN
jgi:Icc-related predicted phosphoesterase